MKNKKLKKIVIIGAGGLAREIRWLIEDINKECETYEFLGFVVSDLRKTGKFDSKDLILGDYSWLELNRLDNFCVAIGIGNPKFRIKVAQELLLLKKNIIYPNLIHPSVKYDKSSIQLGKGILICANTILTVNIKLEDFVFINLSCMVGHESVIGKGSVVNSLTKISGGVQIGEGVLIGSGATVLQYLKIGDFSTIGASALLTKSISRDIVALGVPSSNLKTKLDRNT